MEDRCTWLDSLGSSTWHGPLCAVLDGHTDAACAEFVGAHIGRNVAAALDETGRAEGAEGGIAGGANRAIAALRTAILQTDQHFLLETVARYNALAHSAENHDDFHVAQVVVVVVAPSVVVATACATWHRSSRRGCRVRRAPSRSSAARAATARPRSTLAT